MLASELMGLTANDWSALGIWLTLAVYIALALFAKRQLAEACVRVETIEFGNDCARRVGVKPCTNVKRWTVTHYCWVDGQVLPDTLDEDGGDTLGGDVVGAR